MKRIRVIPTLLLERGRLVKTAQFGARTYIGDPINTVRILNEKEVDELILLDIAATRSGQKPDFTLISEIAAECFMPLAYGGGIRDIDDVRRLFSLGIEKVIINSATYSRPTLLCEIANIFGRQAVVVSIDARKKWLMAGYNIVTHGGTRKGRVTPVDAARLAVRQGAGEIMIANVDRDGEMQGYDLRLIRSVSDAVDVPVIASGGAGSMQDFVSAVTEGHASAVAAGAMFVYKGPHKAVLVNYPSSSKLASEVYSKI